MTEEKLVDLLKLTKQNAGFNRENLTIVRIYVQEVRQEFCEKLARPSRTIEMQQFSRHTGRFWGEAISFRPVSFKELKDPTKIPSCLRFA